MREAVLFIVYCVSLLIVHSSCAAAAAAAAAMYCAATGPPYLPEVKGDTFCVDNTENCADTGSCSSCTTFNQADVDHIKAMVGVEWLTLPLVLLFCCCYYPYAFVNVYFQ